MLLNYHIGRFVLGSLCVGDLVLYGPFCIKFVRVSVRRIILTPALRMRSLYHTL